MGRSQVAIPGGRGNRGGRIWLEETAIQIDALKQLAKHHGVDCGENTGKTFVAALCGGTFARMEASAVKVIPGLGSVLGGVPMSVISAASTYAICHAASHQFRTGKNLLVENLDRAKEIYTDAREKMTD